LKARHFEALSSILEKYTDADALLLDDLGTEKITEFVRETIFVLIDRFYRNEKLLIVTSNFNLGDLAERLGERTADRLVEMCQAVMFTGSSFRHQIAAERAANRHAVAVSPSMEKMPPARVQQPKRPAGGMPQLEDFR